MRNKMSGPCSEPPSPQRIPVEPEFDAFVRAYGGTVVRDTIPKSPTFDNADYLFPRDKIVAELKCLQDDKLEDPDFLAKVDACWAKWCACGRVSGATPETIRSDQIPAEVFSELRAIYSKHLQRVVKKANRQIRETKTELGLSDYGGLLLLANDGNFCMPPDTLLRIVFQIINGLQFRAILECVIFSVNMLARVPGSDIPSHLWLAGHISGDTPISPAAIERLGRAWQAQHEKIAGRKFTSLGGFDLQRFAI